MTRILCQDYFCGLDYVLKPDFGSDRSSRCHNLRPLVRPSDESLSRALNLNLRAVCCLSQSQVSLRSLSSLNLLRHTVGA